jgi:hypothetical protein
MTHEWAGREWHLTEWDCPACSGEVEVFTRAEDGYVFDGEDTRCTQCDWHGSVCIDEEVGDENIHCRAFLSEGNIEELCEKCHRNKKDSRCTCNKEKKDAVPGM